MQQQESSILDRLNDEHTVFLDSTQIVSEYEFEIDEQLWEDAHNQYDHDDLGERLARNIAKDKFFDEFEDSNVALKAPSMVVEQTDERYFKVMMRTR